MKMAKASKRDMEMAMTLATTLESLERGLMPVCSQAADDEDPEDFDSSDDEQCGRALRHVLDVLRDGSIGRVVWGMNVLLDPANKVVDPDADTLEHHPAMLADGARLRWLTEDHADPDKRARCRELLARMPMMSYSAATADIDPAMRECVAVGAA